MAKFESAVRERANGNIPVPAPWKYVMVTSSVGIVRRRYLRGRRYPGEGPFGEMLAGKNGQGWRFVTYFGIGEQRAKRVGWWGGLRGELKGMSDLESWIHRKSFHEVGSGAIEDEIVQMCCCITL